MWLRVCLLSVAKASFRLPAIKSTCTNRWRRQVSTETSRRTPTTTPMATPRATTTKTPEQVRIGCSKITKRRNLFCHQHIETIIIYAYDVIFFTTIFASYVFNCTSISFLTKLSLNQWNHYFVGCGEQFRSNEPRTEVEINYYERQQNIRIQSKAICNKRVLHRVCVALSLSLNIDSRSNGGYWRMKKDTLWCGDTIFKHGVCAPRS